MYFFTKKFERDKVNFNKVKKLSFNLIYLKLNKAVFSIQTSIILNSGSPVFVVP